MHEYRDCRKLANRILHDAVNELEASSAPNIHSVRSVGDASVILGFASYADRCIAILESLPDSAFFVGMIANFPLLKHAPAAFRTLTPLQQLQADHPPQTNASVADYISKCGETEEHLRLVAERNYSDAFDACNSETEVEECAAAQAVLGDIDAALESASTLITPASRADGVRFICTIELFRRGRFDSANKLFDSVYPSKIGSRADQMAPGINGHLPWLGYPFPDW